MLPQPTTALCLTLVATATLVLASPHTAAAQACSTADAAAGVCLILPTPSQATPTGSAFGFAPTAPIAVYATSLGGLSYFSADLYAFQSAPDPLDPLGTSNVLLGSKPVSGQLTTSNPWTLLPWSYVGSSPLYFGLLVNEVIDFTNPTVTQPVWIISGYGASATSRYDQAGNVSPAFSLVFPIIGPIGDQTNINDPQSGREPTPAQWNVNNLAVPAGVNANNRTFLLGFEDNRYYSDGDFNDFVLAVNVSAVPEPGTVALVGGPLLLLGAAIRRRRS